MQRTNKRWISRICEVEMITGIGEDNEDAHLHPRVVCNAQATGHRSGEGIALRVPPAETKLTVYRRVQVEVPNAPRRLVGD